MTVHARLGSATIRSVRWIVIQAHWGRRLAQCEPGQAPAAEDEAVDGEGCQGAGFEVSGEESDGEVGGDECGQASGEYLSVDAVTEGAEEVGNFVYPGGKNDRGCKQE